MSCSGCKYLTKYRGYGGRMVTKCELNKAICWDRTANAFVSGYYCGERRTVW